MKGRNGSERDHHSASHAAVRSNLGIVVGGKKRGGNSDKEDARMDGGTCRTTLNWPRTLVPVQLVRTDRDDLRYYNMLMQVLDYPTLQQQGYNTSPLSAPPHAAGLASPSTLGYNGTHLVLTQSTEPPHYSRETAPLCSDCTALK